VRSIPERNTGLARSPQATRPDVGDDRVKLAFRDEKVETFIPYIHEWTGKAVMMRLPQIAPIRITLVHDKAVMKHEALDLVFQAFRLSGLGVVETDKVIMIDLLTEITKLQPGVVLGPNADVMSLREDGNIVTKIFRIRNAKANDVFDRLQDAIPDYAKLSVDANSNQIMLEGDVGLAKKVQLLIDVLDVPAYVDVRTETFRLQYQDAGIIADNIRELFEGIGSSSPSRTARPGQQARGGQVRPQPGGAQQTVPQVGTSDQLVVAVLPSLNSITVRAEPNVLSEIRRLILTAWDLPPNAEGNIFRTYDLLYTDPIKIRDTLAALLETGGGSRAGARAAAGGRAPQIAGGGEAGAVVAVSNVFRIEAYPDSNRLVVISKTPQNFKWLDQMVQALDQPLQVGLPVNVPLKYASAIEVSDILNVLLAEGGGQGTGLPRPAEGLTGIDFGTAGGGTSGTTGGDRSAAGGAGNIAGEIRFPWQSGARASGAQATQSPESALIGKTRVVPNATQNSLLILAPPEIQNAMVKIIEDLDRPGRQVMITAVLAEVSLGDGFSWGLRFGNNLTTLNGNDNAIGGSIGLDLEKNDFGGDWFDLSVLNVSTDVGFLLQALQTENNVRILQEPRVFTSDNKEAKFFAGQDITFQTGQTTGSATGGGTTSSFETRAVGIGLNVRPRITRDKNVAMDIELLLSNLNLSVPQFNSNPVVDRRQTNTTVTIKNGQTIVISGIRRENETRIRRGLPLLGDIPGIGDLLFSSTEQQKNVAELVIFVTPIVVDNPSENDSNFNRNELGRLENVRTPLEEVKIPRDGRRFFEIGRTDTSPIRPDAASQPGAPAGQAMPVDAPLGTGDASDR
jgi:type II secretion system protein D